ncbi:hypothetical protein PGT21_024837 [Puccinia graminis f. sp. tritici]|uniref:Uncharacterized protein n=1 Tax=Puccinia graminis f. sp. tritici TaxID=56615 RepID=A0A5B0S7I4_PUCGR|nr:hypothetical protein PGT21_024837 [Puccinia graminis f. sp. tritici]KAA1132564.1 hypothetical protein PGTUg99_006090 [Puccinia graminis f. sp. tritici]
MKLQATAVLFALAVMVTAVAHAQRPTLCVWCRKAYGAPCTPDLMLELNLSPTGPCGCSFSKKSDCTNIVPKANFICPQCSAVFITNPDYQNKSVPRPCHHPSVKVIRKGTCPAANEGQYL